MARPAFVIGLGGSGQWVLTRLKKELLDSGRGSMPSTVRLLAIDTTTGIGVREGMPSLDTGAEFIQIGANSESPTRNVKKRQPPGLEWFSAESISGTAPPGAFDHARGSGQNRQFGRLALFRGDTPALLYSKLRDGIQNLKPHVSSSARLEILLVASLAGGTGAGMFLDVGHFVREQAETILEKNFLLRAFLILPGTFMGKAGLDASLRAGAALRELGRFQGTANAVMASLFDRTYLIDPHGETGAAEKNQQSLFQSISDFIQCLLDDHEAVSYESNVSRNIAAIPQMIPDAFGSMGVFTYLLPIREALQKLSPEERKKLTASITDSPLEILKKEYLDSLARAEPNQSSLHVFKAENNASLYERQWHGFPAGRPRILHPRVVALLEDRERFELFFEANALGLVRRKGGKEPDWEYRLSARSEPINLTSPDSSSEQGVFQAIHNFVHGRGWRLGTACIISWDEVHAQILERQKKLGKAERLRRFERQLAGPRGLVSRILAEGEKSRSGNQAQADDLRRASRDLADLTSLVICNSMEKIKNPR